MRDVIDDHQQKAVDKLSNGNILCGGVGVGKSRTAIAYFYSKVCGGVYDDLSSLRRPRDLYIITTAKKRDKLDWEAEAQLFTISRERTASVSNIKLTVDSWNNIGKYEDIEDAFFIFDEQRVVGSGAWVKSFYKIAQSNQWIMLSATPGDTWIDYIPVFVANGFFKNRTEFKREHCIYSYYGQFPKLERYVGAGKLVRLRNQILVDMPYERHTRRNIETITVDYDKQLFDKVLKKRWHVYEERPLKDVAELFRVMRKVVNSDSSRLREVRGLLQTHPRLIVFYNFDYELELLRTLGSPSSREWNEKPTSSRASMPSEVGSSGETRLESTSDLSAEESSRTSSTRSSKTGSGSESRSMSDTGKSQETREIVRTSKPSSSLTVAEWNGHKHEEIPKTDRWLYLVQYQAGAEGWNCIETDAMVFFSLTYSFKHFHQAQGRTDRLNTPFVDLYYYILKSNAMIDRAIWKALSQKRDFNEKTVTDI